jgi:hypothetical protein
MSEPSETTRTYQLTDLDVAEYWALCAYVSTQELRFKAYEGYPDSRTTNECLKALCRSMIMDAENCGIIRPGRWALEVGWTQRGPAHVTVSVVFMPPLADLNITVNISVMEGEDEDLQ